ncbi:MAG TPA: Ku protein [Clostridiales bacterium]|jgi:DNA end-binding protein Ku|nr:Ku protein [Clostridiales bacterium]
MSFSYKSSISFGLVYIPIKLVNVIKTNAIGFNMIDKKTNSRISHKKVSQATGEEVPNEDIVKGYQYEKDRYVIFEDSDFEKIKTKKDKTITIESFVDIKEIDPVYYDKPYFVVPNGAERAFVLLKEAMQKENKVGIAKTVLGSKENLVALRVNNGEMMLSTLYFFSEVQKNPIKEMNIKPEEKEIELARMIINNMTRSFEPENYSDEYNIKLKKAIEDKIKGEEITVAEDQDMPHAAINLMEALQRTINMNKQAHGG